MDNEEKGKLKTLLAYWIEHNSEHGDEFRDWAEKVEKLGEPGVAGVLLKAVEQMERAGELLSEARKRLEG